MSQKKSIFFVDKNNELLEIDILPIPDWDGFSKILKFLEQNYDAKIIESFDGIGSRRCKLLIENNTVELVHDDLYGNSLRSISSHDIAIVKTIGKDLEERLKNI